MTTECNQLAFAFHPLGSRDVVGRFDGGRITSDAGGLLLTLSAREIETCNETGRKSEQG